MPAPVQRQMEASFGADFSDVRVHQDGAAESIGAQAFARGSDLHFAAGQYAPDSLSGRTLLAHELTHTLQQAEGRVESPEQAKGGDGVNEDPALEREADELGARAARGEVVRSGGGGARGAGLVSQPKRGPGVIQAFNRHTATGPEGHGPNTADAGAATETPATYQTAAQLRAMTVAAFITYADSQADWSMEITDAAVRQSLRQLLTFVRGAPARRTALRTFTVGDMVDEAMSNLDAIDAYSRGRTDGQTVPVNAATTVADARDMGADILALEAVMGGAQLKHIFNATAFDDLRNENRIAMFANYVQTCQPLLHARDGVEIDSFNWLADVSDPASYNDIADVRNYHRFEDPALQAMRTNQAGNSSNKPMLLVLHSAFDHNGAFHHDPEMTRVMTESSNHAVMVEGAESLSAISGRLPDLVEQHGREEADPANPGQKVKRIDQLMIAGHGSAHSIELAGTLATDDAGHVRTDRDGDPITQQEGIDVDGDPSDPASMAEAARSRQFLASIMGLMSTDPSTPHGRIIFNACLTASNEIDPDLIDPSASPADQQNQMQNAIAASPSLVTAMRQIGDEQGRGAIEVLGGNGSFGVVGLMDSTGGLDIVADGTGDRTDDPELTNPDKFIYVERGTDPGGCMSAVAECWATDRTRALASVRARLAAPIGTGWDERVTQTFYQLVANTYPNNGAHIVRLAAAIEGFKELGSSNDAAVWRIWNFRTDWAHLHAQLSTHDTWTNNAFVPMVFFQAWMWHDQAKQADFLAAIGAMTCREARPYAQLDRLRTPWPTLVPTTAGSPPDPGRLRLALLDIAIERNQAHAASKAYLSSLVTSGAFTVDINTPLDGLSDEDAVLMTLGLHPRLQTGDSDSSDDSTPPPDANVDMDQDGDNESLVTPMSANGTVNARALYVRAQPTIRGRPLDRLLHRGETVYIMGATGNWYLVDLDGQRGYSYKRYIDVAS